MTSRPLILQLLHSISGVGPRLAEIAVAMIDYLRRFRSGKRLSKIDIIGRHGYVQQSRDEMEVRLTLLVERYERQRHADQQPSVLEVGKHLQGSADDRHGHRPPGT